MKNILMIGCIILLLIGCSSKDKCYIEMDDTNGNHYHFDGQVALKENESKALCCGVGEHRGSNQVDLDNQRIGVWCIT